MSRDPYDPQQHQIGVLEEIRDSLDLIASRIAPQPAPRSDAAAPLDVERLDDALARLASDGYIIEVTGQTIANEYAHLATPAPKEPTDG